MSNRKTTFNSVRQIRKLLKRYPADHLDIEGLILDYLGRTGDWLDEVFDLNAQIYKALFTTSNEEEGRRFLNSVVEDSSRQELAERCMQKYPIITDIINKDVTRATATSERISDLVGDPERTLGYHIDMVLWHISDIHFGKFNKFEPDPRELAFTMAKLATDHKKVKPDALIVTGDVSSMAAPGEFEDFKSFCREFSDAVWDAPHPERILVVPGNHDVTWIDDGTADRMTAFAQAFKSDEVCITPFGRDKVEFADGGIRVMRVNPNSPTVPPFAIVHNLEKRIEFILLVSGYFSGEIPAEVRKALSSGTGSQQDFLNLLRLDQGAVNQEYLFCVSKMLEPRLFTALGVIHHNPVQYGIETCQNSLAPQLMETLWMKKVPMILHGHVHLAESKGGNRPVVRGASYPIPAPTLCSIPAGGSGRGLNIHFIGPFSNERKIDTLVWNFSESRNFKPADAVLRYSFVLRKDDIELKYMSQSSIHLP